MAAILSLALGIGGNTAIFSLIDAVMLRSLPVQHPEELVAVEIGSGLATNNRVWEQIRDRQDVFSGIFAFGRWAFNLADGGEVHAVNGHFVSGQYFETLGVHAVLGRPLTPSDDWPGCKGAAVLRYGFWQSEYGGDAGVVGRNISIDRNPIPVVGIAEPGFTGVEVGTTADIMVPICAERVIHGANSRVDIDTLPGFFQIVGRLKPGISAAQAAARFKTLAPEIFKATLPAPGRMRPESYSEYLANTFKIEPAANGLSYVRGQYGEVLLVLMGMVGLILLICCANVANLLLARGAAREHEISIRLALGCGVGRLVREQLVESLMLSAAGAGLGILLAAWGTHELTRYLNAYLNLSPDIWVLGFTAGVAVLTSLLCGLAPAWRGARVQPQTAIRAKSRGITEGRQVRGKALLIAQIALSLVLVVGAGLMLNTFRKLTSFDTGFDRNGVLLISVGIPDDIGPHAYPKILEKLRGIPGVRAASLSNIFPICHCRWSGGLEIEGETENTREEVMVNLNQVSDGYFETLGTKLIAGRDFDGHDTPSSALVAIVNETAAQRYFGGANPLGRYIRISQAGRFGETLQIVGIVQGAKYGSLRDDFPPTVYTAWMQYGKPAPLTKFELRPTGGKPEVFRVAVKDAITGVDPRISIQFTTLAESVEDSVSRERLMAALSGLFGGLAVVLAAIGLYGVTSYNVARRTKEIGIRTALGADPKRVIGMLLKEVGFVLGAGLAIGFTGVFAVARLIESFVYGVTPTDPPTLLACAAVLSIVVVVAGYLPARRALRLDPLSALREE